MAAPARGRHLLEEPGARTPSPLRAPAATVDLQVQAARWAASPDAAAHLDWLHETSERPLFTVARPAAAVQASLVRAAGGRTTWISADAGAMIEAVSSSVPAPDGGQVGAGMIPDPAGMLWLAGDPAMIFFDHRVRAVSWSVQTWTAETEHGPASNVAACVVWPWAEENGTLAPLPMLILPLAESACAMIDDPTAVATRIEWTPEAWTSEAMETPRWLLAAWTLCREVLPRAIEPLDRHRRRRIRRLPILDRPEWGEIHVTTLRRAARSDQNEGDEPEGRYGHRWVVRGHWRWQACGEGRRERKLTWIAPHVKGPEGAPLVEIDQAAKLVR